MFHKQYNKIIESQEEEIRYLRMRITQLEEALDVHLRVIPPTSTSRGKVVYMDDKRMAELDAD